MIDLNEINFKKFPGGELHLTDEWLEKYGDEQDTILCRITSSDDIIKLCLFVDAFRREMGKPLDTLVLPYIPYARQDRVPNAGEALSIKVFCNIINNLNFKEVIVFDPHSDVSTALLDNVKVIPQWVIFPDKIKEHVDLISPDAGALKKIYKLQSFIKHLNNQIDVNLRTATKHRDTQTGWITDTTLDGEPKHKTAVVVDDICDGGGTFIALGKVLKQQYEKTILMVTHGIFSKGLDELTQYYDEIVCTNSWKVITDTNPKLEVINVKSLI